MKINKKIIVSTLAIAMGATLAGSISGTVAWYQYSTRAQAAYIGTSVGKSENLEISADGQNWKSELRSTDIVMSNGFGSYVEPVTSGPLAKSVAVPAATSFYANPTYGVEGYDDWEKATAASIVQFNIRLRYKKVASNAQGTDSETSYLAKDLNLVDLTIKDETGADLWKAVRVHIGVGNNYNLFARDKATNDSENAEVETLTYGKLDTRSVGTYDTKEGYEWDTNLDQLTYGLDGSKQIANNAAVANFSKKIGEIPANETGVTATVTIWLEGWQKLSSMVNTNADKVNNETESAIWNPTTYVNKAFKVGMRFSATDAA